MEWQPLRHGAWRGWALGAGAVAMVAAILDDEVSRGNTVKAQQPAQIALKEPAICKM